MKRSLPRRLLTVLAIAATFFTVLFLVSPHLLLGNDLGETCSEDSDCRSSLCLRAGDIGYCTQRCDADDDCSSPLRCASLRGERACLRVLELSAPCLADAECRGGLCIAESGKSTGICSQPCDNARPCPENTRCTATSSGDACMP